MIGVDSVAAGSVPEGTVTAVMVAAMASSFRIWIHLMYGDSVGVEPN